MTPGAAPPLASTIARRAAKWITPIAFCAAVQLAAPCQAHGQAHGQAKADCSGSGGETATIVGVEPGLELRLADRRLLRLAGADPALATPGNPDLAEQTRADLAAILAGHSISVRILEPRPDRWGRLPAVVFAGMDVTAAAIRAGLARYRPEPAAHGCRDAFLSAEAVARAAHLGLWRDPYYAVLAVDDRAALARHSATFVLAEGRLVAVDADPHRTKLRFAPGGDGGRDALVATVLPREMKRFEAEGIHFQSLIGRTLRMRGLLDLRFGPELELANPDALEILPPDPLAAGHG